MTFGKRIGLTFGAVVLGALVSASAVAQTTARLVTAGGAATSVKILPGATVPMDLRLDEGPVFGPIVGGTGLAGFTMGLIQTAPASSSWFSLTGRSFVGSPFNSTTSGTPDATVLVAPSNLLDPANDDNLGRTTLGLVGVPPANNILAVNLTLTSSASTPLATYTIALSAGGASPITSIVSDDVGNDYPVSAAYTVIVGQTLTVTKSGTGTGTVTSPVGPSAINCGATCSDIFPGGTVTLTAAPAVGSTFVGFTGGGCSGAGLTCVVPITVATTVDAQFALAPQALTVTLAGTGTGTVTSAPAGITCPGTCSAPFPSAPPVVLTAVAAVGSTFTGWSGGGCSGTGTCTVTVNAPVAVTATFLLPSFTLTVAKAGNGASTGSVTSAPAGITCGATCSAPFTSGSSVTLTATAPGAPGAVFTGWSGGSPACSGVGTCTVSMTAAQTVTATFVDSTVPVTTLGTTPTNPSNVGNPSFTFTSSEAGSTFLCTLDGSAPFACVSGVVLTVANGSHTFTVQAVDPAGNLGNIVSFTWLVAGVAAVATVIPTLNEWMLVLLGLLVGTAGIVLVRRRKA